MRKAVVVKVITNKVEYLLRILMDLIQNESKGYMLSKDIAERQSIPPKYMPQLMALLTRQGWVTSMRGAGGGVRLAVDPDSISIYDVVTAAGEPLLIKPCVEKKYACSLKESCPLLPVWEKTQQEINKVLKDTTLSELVENQKTVKGGMKNVKN
ncbi:MAG: Rrf2 family transcriptional regulator [Firmicutes bacterium]|nr:Rrf2 family transcriptional regulator [Bacillota bacterium]